jgi:hypothetical protein
MCVDVRRARAQTECIPKQKGSGIQRWVAIHKTPILCTLYAA